MTLSLVLIAACVVAAALADDSSYINNFQQICVGDSNNFKQSLPCPDNCLASCIYTINMTATSYYWFESDPTVTFIVFPTGGDFSAWNSGNSFNYVTLVSDQEQIGPVTFYVPPGQTYVFIAYNGNWLQNMYLTGSIEYFPNTSPGSNNNVPGASSQFSAANNALNNDAMFALGFVIGLDDSQPYSPPTQTCLSSITGMVTLAETLITDYSNVASSANMLSAGATVLSDVQSLYTAYSTAMGNCQLSNCPGWAQELLTQVLEDAVQAIPVANVVVDAEKGLELVYHGYDMVKDIIDLVNAADPGLYYKRGNAMGRIASQIKALIGVVARRDVDNSTASTSNSTSTQQFTLRHNDGVVRTLAQWQELYPHGASSSSTSHEKATAYIGGAIVGAAFGAMALAAVIYVLIDRVRGRRHDKAMNALQQQLLPAERAEGEEQQEQEHSTV